MCLVDHPLLYIMVEGRSKAGGGECHDHASPVYMHVFDYKCAISINQHPCTSKHNNVTPIPCTPCTCILHLILLTFPLGFWSGPPRPPSASYYYTGTRGSQPTPHGRYVTPPPPGGDTDSPSPPTIRYEVIYPYDARLPDELTIRPGDVITAEEGYNEEDSLWWMGIDEDGYNGYFYVMFAERLNESDEEESIESSTSATSADMYSVSFEGVSYFVEDQPGDELECIICKNLAYNPHQSKCCGHTMCYDCAHRWGKRNDYCPQCGGPPLEIAVDTRTKRHISNLTVYCTHYRSGCEWKGSFNTVRDHLSEDCPYEDVECGNDGCTERLQRWYLAEHMDRECSMRIVKCPCCIDDGLLYHELVNAHYKECPGWPMRCPHHCSTEVKLTRWNLQDHLDNICPEQVISCPFAEGGCPVWVKRKNMANHMRQSVAEHMTAVMMSDYMRLKKGHTEIQTDHRDLEEEHYVLKEDHHSLIIDHDALKKAHFALNKDFSVLRKDHTALVNHHRALINDYTRN